MPLGECTELSPGIFKFLDTDAPTTSVLSDPVTVSLLVINLIVNFVDPLPQLLVFRTEWNQIMIVDDHV